MTYIVEADGPIGTITYTNFVGNKIGQEQSSDEIWGPVEKFYNFDAFGFESSYGFWSLGVSAQAGAATSTITCHIVRDGREISKQTSTGQYSVVTCNVGGWRARKIELSYPMPPDHHCGAASRHENCLLQILMFVYSKQVQRSSSVVALSESKGHGGFWDIDGGRVCPI